MAKRRLTFAFAGLGALVQLLGLLAFGTAAYLGFQAPPLGWGWLGNAGSYGIWGLGLVVCTALFIVGSRMSERFVCGGCRGKLPGRYATECPHCGVVLR
jgi:hypothetical protein